jgi:TonB-dependent SusC/RagA subfamily outer membrane receptor
MEHPRSCAGQPLTLLSGRQHRSAIFSLATLMIVTGCTYAAATERQRLADPLAKIADSVSTWSSVDLGYARQPRASITGAVSSLSLSDGSRRMHTRSLAELLQGRIPGLSVEPVRGGGIFMRVRGGGGEFGTSPLVVVDGDPLPSGVALSQLLAAIDPDDVVRVDVLKDVSSTAIYGTRGSAGVVLITMRHKAP